MTLIKLDEEDQGSKGKKLRPRIIRDSRKLLQTQEITEGMKANVKGILIWSSIEFIRRYLNKICQDK